MPPSGRLFFRGPVGGAVEAKAAPRARMSAVSDGSFQETAQELATMLRHGHMPVIFLINNGGYAIERGYMGKTAGDRDGTQR